MAHKSFINEEGYVEVMFDGDADLPSTIELLASVERQTVLLGDRGAPVLILVDFTRFNRVLRFVKSIATSSMKDLQFKKMAGFGAAPWLRAFTNSVAIIAGRTDKTRHFKTREEAIAWLKA